MLMHGKVALVGAGPGDPELLTLKAVRRLAEAEVVVHDRLVSTAVLDLASPKARLVPVGKTPGCHPVPQEKINAILVDLACQGLRVVRLKGGDPLIFGRGSEEAAALRNAGVPVEIIPGITAAQGVSAATGVPLTHRGLATGVRYVTGHCRAGAELNLDWAGLADPDTTLVVYMGRASMARIASELIAHGMPATLPVLAIANGTRPDERRLASRLDRIGRDIDGLPSGCPVLAVIGRVAGSDPALSTETLARELANAARADCHV